MGNTSNRHGDAPVPSHRAIASRASPAIALAALLAASPAAAEVAPPLKYESLRTTTKLYETYKEVAGDRIALQIQILRRSASADEKRVTDLLAANTLTAEKFCDDPSKSLYVSTTLSGIHVGKAMGANAYEALSKYCLTGLDSGKIWSFVLSGTVARDYTRINPETGDVMQHRTYALMGLSTRPDPAPRQHRYPDLVLAFSEAMSNGQKDFHPLAHSDQFPSLPQGVAANRLSTSNAYASAVDIGGLALLAKTISLPLSTKEPLAPFIIISGRVVPLVISVRELPRKAGDAYNPFQLEVRAKQGTQPIVIRVKGDKDRTIEEVNLPFLQGMVSLYETFRPFLGQ